ncbi:MAG: type II toxin-antitoxin system VapC family toxin [Chloroflexi bacterium]|nr:type II toxin-antitoxin system VapC family toxin [Chloroflexota bacterium]
MNGNYLLDTSIITALFRKDAIVAQRLEIAPSVFVSSTTLGELYYGAQKSGRVNENLNQVDEFVARNQVLDCDLNTAKTYGEIKNQLRKKGRMLPENDIWISAVAVQHGLTLVTRDAHFNEVEGLQIENW